MYIIIRLELENRPGVLGTVASKIGEFGGDIGAIDIVHTKGKTITRDITVNVRDEKKTPEMLEGLKSLSEVRVINVSDRTFLMHLGGKIEVKNRVPIKNRDDLSMVYTPGVARVSMAIREDEDGAYTLTMKKNTIAIVTDGSAVLGLGDIGPKAALPVMEGKAMIFKEFADVDAFPIGLDTKDVDEIVSVVRHISPNFGGINLEDISAPRCFEIEDRLREALDIPVFHDDQHGTAIVIFAALINALKVVDKAIDELKVVVSGVGAAGVAVTKFLRHAGVREIIGCDRSGAIYRGREENMNPVKEEFARITNPGNLRGTLEQVIRGADVFIGVSAPGVLSVSALRSMGRDPVVFALANPNPEIMPEDAEPFVRVMATGRSDYPNQINNALCFPGLFRGLLDCRARKINRRMEMAAARAIAGVVPEDELNEDYIIPTIFNKDVAVRVAEAVMKAARRTGAARK